MKTKMKASQNKKCFLLFFFFPKYFNFRQCLSDCVFGCTWSHLEADVMNWRLVVQQLAVRRNEKKQKQEDETSLDGEAHVRTGGEIFFRSVPSTVVANVSLEG